MLIPSTVGSFILTNTHFERFAKGSKQFSENTIPDQTSETTRHAIKLLPSFSLLYEIGEVFMKWLTVTLNT